MAKGEAEIGMQQINVILPVAVADYVGPLPAELQDFVDFAVGVPAVSKQPGAALTAARRPGTVSGLDFGGRMVGQGADRSRNPLLTRPEGREPDLMVREFTAKIHQGDASHCGTQLTKSHRGPPRRSFSSEPCRHVHLLPTARYSACGDGDLRDHSFTSRKNPATPPLQNLVLAISF